MKDKRFIIIFLIVFTNLLGFGVIIPLLPYYIEKMGAGVVTLGLLASTYSLFQLISSPFLGHLSDKIGRRPILIFSILGTALAFFITGLATNIGLLFFARILDGLSGGNISTAQAYIADITTKEDRSQGLGIIMAAMSLGLILGPALGGLLSIKNYSLPFYIAGFLALIAALLTFFFLPESVKKNKPSNQNRTVNLFKLSFLIKYPDLPFLIIISFTAMFSFALIQSTFAFFSEHTLGLDAKTNGLLFTYLGILGVLTQFIFLKQLIKKMSSKPIIILTGFGMAVALVEIGLSKNLIILSLAVTILAISRGIFRPVLLGEISTSVPENNQGAIAGINQSANSLARLIGPLIGAFLYQYFNPRFPFLFSGFILIITLTAFWLSWQKNNLIKR